MLSFQRLLPRAGVLFGVFSLLMISASAQIIFTVNATATSTGLAYTSGNSYTFTYTLNDYSPTTPAGSSLSNNTYSWTENSTSDPVLFSSFSGDGLSGTYTRPSVPQHTISVTDTDQGSTGNRLMLSVIADTGSSGLTFNGGGEGLYGIQMQATYAGLSFDVTNDGTPPNPITYFSSLLGTYTATSTTTNTFALDNVNFTQVDFTVNSLTIAQASAVPEPSTYAAIAGLGAFGLAFWHRRRKAAVAA